MAASSLSLLKKAPKVAEAAEPAEVAKTSNVKVKAKPPEPAAETPVQEIPAAEAPPTEAAAPIEEEVTVDIDNLGVEELEQVVKENEVKTPKGWAKMGLEKKKEWLKSQFEETPAEQPGTEVAISTTKQGEVLPPDEISETVLEIESLKEQDAKDMINMLANSADLNMFKMGGVISRVQANPGWWKSGPVKYDNLRAYLEAEHSIEYRKAMYWADIFNKLVESKVPWAKVSGVQWSKLKEIVGLITPENVDQWVKIAKEQNTDTLIQTVKQSKAAALGATGETAQIEAGKVNTVTTMTFKVHDDQKSTIKSAIDKAKTEGNTQVDTVALEWICMDYLGGASKPVVKLEDQLKTAGLETALDALAKAYPDHDFTVEAPEVA